MRHRTRVLVLAVCAAGSLVTGCSGGSGGTAGGSAQRPDPEATSPPRLLANAPAPTLVPPMPWPADPVTQARVPAGPPEVTQVRTGRHAGYDRFSVSVSGEPTGYQVRYVPAISRPGSQERVELDGQAFLEIVLAPASPPRERRGEDRDPPPPSTDPVRVGGRSISSYVLAGDADGSVTLGVGVPRKLGFKVGELNRDGVWVLYVDVQHPVS